MVTFGAGWGEGNACVLTLWQEARTREIALLGRRKESQEKISIFSPLEK